MNDTYFFLYTFTGGLAVSEEECREEGKTYRGWRWFGIRHRVVADDEERKAVGRVRSAMVLWSRRVEGC